MFKIPKIMFFLLHNLSNPVTIFCCLTGYEQNEYHIQVAHSLGFPMSPNTTMFDED